MPLGHFPVIQTLHFHSFPSLPATYKTPARSHDHTSASSAPSPLSTLISLKILQLLFVNRSPPLAPYHHDCLHGIHPIEFHEGDGHEHRRPSQSRDAVHGDGPMFLILRGGRRTRTASAAASSAHESILYQRQPSIQHGFGGGVSVLVRHLVQTNSRGRELPPVVRGLAHPDDISDVVPTAFLYVEVEVGLSRSVHDEEAEVGGSYEGGLGANGGHGGRASSGTALPVVVFVVAAVDASDPYDRRHHAGRSFIGRVSHGRSHRPSMTCAFLE
mmetsp:Transcript_23183/g.55920  ORF Transcript_23183/g.55920 Transcript_23183/m.55920 type:complete len:272 (+) Transcript_23183:275-1090(+)